MNDKGMIKYGEIKLSEKERKKLFYTVPWSFHIEYIKSYMILFHNYEI